MPSTRWKSSLTVASRSRVPQAEWDALCRVMEKEFMAGRYGEGALAAINGAAALLEKHFPPQAGGRNELPDQPLLL